MSCEDKKVDINELVSDINKDIKLKQNEQIDFTSPNEDSLESIEDILQELASQSLCKSPSNPVISPEQLAKLGCIDKSEFKEIPEVNVNLEDINTGPNEEGHNCGQALEKANSILKKEQEEYSNLNILLQKLIEYQDNYKVLEQYYVERSKEMNRLMGIFQPILEEIKSLKAELLLKKVETSTALNNVNNSIYGSTIYELYYSVYQDCLNAEAAIELEIQSLQNDISNKTDLETILSDSSLTSSFNFDTTYSTSFYYAVRDALDSVSFNDIKNSIRDYSTCVEAKSNLSYNIQSYISSPVIEFEIDFIGINFIKSQKDIYNEKNGKRSTKKINFPIKGNPLLQKNDFFNNTTGLSITNASFNKTFSGVLYTQYYNKLNDPVEKLFSINERGLTSSVNLVDKNLRDKSFNKKKEGSKEYFIKDQEKLSNFYENFEQKLEQKKETIRKNKIEPAFKIVAENLKNLARVDIKLLLTIGGVNTDLLDDSSNLQTIVQTVKNAQEDFIKKNKNLKSEISRIKKRMEEIKPTQDRVKELLIKLDSACFSKKTLQNSSEELENKANKVKGDDPFGEKSLNGTDPTMPSIYDLKYWLEFSKILNKVALLPIPKNPTTLRYWPVGFFFPTPAGKLIKIPLPIIWIPLLVTPSPIGVTVIFLTINGLFISPIMFNINATGSKQHLLTLRGPSKQFGYTKDPVSNFLKISLSIAAAKKASLNKPGLDNLSEKEKNEYNIKIESLKNKLSKAKPETPKHKRISEKIKNLEESVSGKSENEKVKDAVDKKESALDAIEKAKESVKDKMNQMGEPKFTNSLAIQDAIEKRRLQKQKEIDDIYMSSLPPKEKRKKLKALRKEKSEEGVSKSEKEEAIRKDTMEFFDNISLPSIKIPSDSTKLNPPPTPLEQLKENVEEKNSDKKDDPTSDKNRIIKDIMKGELPNAIDLIDLNNLPVNSNNKIIINDSFVDIKKKFNEIREQISNTLKGNTDLNEEKAKLEIEELIGKIKNENDKKIKRRLKKELNIKESKLSNHKKALEYKKDNSLNDKKRKEVSESKFKFSAFKTLDDLKPKIIDFSPKKADLLPIITADNLLKSYIDSLSVNDVKELFGGSEETTVSSIQDAYFNIINSEVKPDLKLNNKPDSKKILESSAGVLSSISIPSKKVDLLKPFTLSKKIPIDLNMLLGPLKSKIEEDMKNLDGCLPVDIENNFKSLNPSDIKVYIENKILFKLNDLVDIIKPIYALINLLVSTKGITLSGSQIRSFLLPPFGPIDFAIFTADALAKIKSPNSSNIPTFDLPGLDKAKETINKIVSPIMDVPLSYAIPAGAASIGLADTQRLLHPVMRADDIPPWERLSSKNFLFILFLDEFISEAADKVGFFRSFI